MRSLTFLACVALLTVPSAFAQPATEPSAPRPTEPTTRPVPAEAGTILVLPLAEFPGVSRPWLGKGIQQDIQIELGQTTRAAVSTSTSILPAKDEAAAIQAGRSQNASMVVYGQYQITGDQLRIGGQIVDVKTSKPAGSFSAAGSANNLFPIENAITEQILHALPAGWVTASFSPPAQDGAAPKFLSTDITTPAPQYYSYTYPDYVGPGPGYSYEYGPYPYYGYSVPYYGPDLWFYGDWDLYHHHYWHHGWDGWHGHEFAHGVPHGASHGLASHGGGGHAGGGHGGGGHR